MKILAPIIGTASTDWPDDDCAHEGLYHVAVAPSESLAMQARIARAVYLLPRPITASAFYGAALMAEDDYHGVGHAWSEDHLESWLEKVKQMWCVVRRTQLTCS